jgi:DNA-binding SARP family transcriptional activator
MTLTLTRPEPDPTITVTMIGALTIRRGDTVLRAHELGGPKPRQILEILLLNFGRPVSKDRLIDLLWGDTPPHEALTSLESYVSVLRRHLQPGHGRFGPLRTTTGGYLIDGATVELDLALFDALTREAQRASADAAYPLLVEALSLASGPLLGDELRPAWAEAERRRHAVAVTTARVRAAESAAAIGRIDESIAWANEALLDDQVNEAAWTALILGLETSGRFAEGLRCFARYRTVLDRELGCAPSSTLRDAHSRILMATAHSQGDLSNEVSALLVLNERLLSIAKTKSAPDDTSAWATAREAEHILSSFLRRAIDVA